jgi:hypothetical protein
LKNDNERNIPSTPAEGLGRMALMNRDPRLYEISELDELAFSGHIGGNRRLSSWPLQSAAITA